MLRGSGRTRAGALQRRHHTCSPGCGAVPQAVKSWPQSRRTGLPGLGHAGPPMSRLLNRVSRGIRDDLGGPQFAAPGVGEVVDDLLGVARVDVRGVGGAGVDDLGALVVGGRRRAVPRRGRRGAFRASSRSRMSSSANSRQFVVMLHAFRTSSGILRVRLATGDELEI